MELLLSIGALGVAVAAVVLALTLRSRLESLERFATAGQRFEDEARRAHEAMHSELGDMRRLLEVTRRELDAARGELSELKVASEVLPPPPPLPKSRTARLEDLRQQLRAAHRETDDADQA